MLLGSITLKHYFKGAVAKLTALLCFLVTNLLIYSQVPCLYMNCFYFFTMGMKSNVTTQIYAPLELKPRKRTIEQLEKLHLLFTSVFKNNLQLRSL